MRMCKPYQFSGKHKFRLQWSNILWDRQTVISNLRGIIQFSSVAHLCPVFCDPMDCSMPGLPVHHQLPELARIHVRWVGDAIQPSHPLSPPSPSAFNISQHQGLSQWVSSLHQMTKILEIQLQHQSFQWIFRKVSFRIDWFDLLAVQETFKSLLQHHSSKASTVLHSAFFTVQLTSIHDHWKNHSFD